MLIQRFWEMPSKWTFKMRVMKGVLAKYRVGKNWADPFAGCYSPAEFTNDIEGRVAHSEMDGLEFLSTLTTNSVTGVLFDPPYSVEQCLRRYTPKQGGTAGRAEYWSQCKNQIARILVPTGIVISCCWDSSGLGKERGFTIQEIVLICHGACHHDTIVTIETKNEETSSLFDL